MNKDSNKCKEIGQSLGAVSGLIFESLGLYLATKNLANNLRLLPGPDVGDQHNLNHGMLVYNILSGLGKVSKSAIEYGFEFICPDSQDSSGNNLNTDIVGINDTAKDDLHM